MRIDHEQNPLGIVRRFTIPYAEGLYLEGTIRGITEEGFGEVNWFAEEVRYVKHNCEIGGVQLDPRYQALRRGAPDLSKVEKMMRRFCKARGLEISAESNEVVGVNN